MSTTLELAIASLIDHNRTPTTIDVFYQYVLMAGYQIVKDKPVMDEAIIAFEHAMDKYPTPSMCKAASEDIRVLRKRQVYAETIVGIRREYWKRKLGAAKGDIQRVTCWCCGVTLDYVEEACPDGSDVSALEGIRRNAEERRRRKARKKRLAMKLRKAAAALESNEEDQQPEDPYAPSTSASHL